MIRTRRMAAVATVLMLVAACSEGPRPSVEPTAKSSALVDPTPVATTTSLDESCKLTGERPGTATLTSDDSNLYVAFEGLPPSPTDTTGYFVSVYDTDGNGGQLGVRYLDGEQMAFFIAIDMRQTNLRSTASVSGNRVEMAYPKSQGGLGDLEIAKWNASWSLAGTDVGMCPPDYRTQPVTGLAS